jgi:RNA polymerase sigma factor (sigma-70 family)
VILDEEQVHDLCRIRDAGVVAGAALDDNDQARHLVHDANATELVQLVQAGVDARHALVENGVGLVRFIITQTSFAGDRADVFQEGMLAVVKAVDSYNPDRGTFATFMWPHIRGAVLKSMATDAGRLHLTAPQARDRVAVLRELNLRQTTGPSDAGTDLATALNISQARVDRALAFRPHSRLPDPLHGGEDVADRAPVEESPTVPIERFVGMLPTRERNLMQLIYGFSGPPHTSAQIAATMGCSLRTVDRLRHEAQQHLRELLDHFGDAPDTTQSRSNTQRLSAASGLARSGPHATGFGRSTSVRPANPAHRSPPI